MHFKEIPGHLNFKTPNPELKGITEGKLKVVDKATPLQSKYHKNSENWDTEVWANSTDRVQTASEEAVW